ncbi:hypothetical protein [Yersinia ruckeri]|uniref:hypothetical protein n=1 Tax=Yersinia ruckeri TaxID=29486 RepID=UPI0022373972|nr:hypothetical protein [Yersinia ruckeri]MCW6598888.1 hypothetical protein [Yersinia ruckeri]
MYQGQMTSVAALGLNKLTLESGEELFLPNVIPSGNIFCIFETHLPTIDPLKVLSVAMEEDFKEDCRRIEAGETNPFNMMREYVLEGALSRLSSERTGYSFKLNQNYYSKWLKPGDVVFTKFDKDGVYPVIVKEISHPFSTVVYPYDDAASQEGFDTYSLGLLSLVSGIYRQEDYASIEDMFADIAKEIAANNFGDFSNVEIAKQVCANYRNGVYIKLEEPAE